MEEIRKKKIGQGEGSIGANVDWAIKLEYSLKEGEKSTGKIFFPS